MEILQSIASNVRFFDHSASSYDRGAMGAGWLTAPRMLYSLQSPYFSKTDTLLDLGCGTGLVGMVYKEKGLLAHMTGIDGSPKMLQRAKRNGYMDALVEMDLSSDPLTLPFGDRTILHVTACGLLPYIADIEPLFAEVARVLQIGGTFAFDYEPLAKKAMDRCVKKDSRYFDRQVLAEHAVHYCLHDETRILDLLERCGLVVDNERKQYPVLSTKERDEIFFNGIVAMRA